MKKALTFLTFVFLTNSLLFGQCPDSATPNPTNRTFNLSYILEADRDAAWNALDSITFPAGDGCMCGSTVDIAKADLTIDGPVSAANVYRIRATVPTNDYFGGENGNFEGNVTFNYMDGTTDSCDYMTSSNSDIDFSTPMVLFPNPVKDQLTIVNGKGKMTIYNILGQPVQQKNIHANQASIQVDDLLNGQYFLQVIQADGTIVTEQFSKK